MRKILSNILIYGSLSFVSYRIIFYGIPLTWSWANEATTSFMSKLWFIVSALQTIPILILVFFFIIFVLEPAYKKFYEYDISKKKWVRKS